MNVIYQPFSGDGNQYSENMHRVIEKAHGRVISYKAYLLNSEIRKRTDSIFLNWFEDLNAKAQWKNIVRLITRSIVISLISMSKLKMIYVMHNVRSHEHRMDRYSLYLRKKLVKKSDAIVILCEKSREILLAQIGDQLYASCQSKILKLPIPNYMEAHKSTGVDYNKRLGISGDPFVSVFIGAIRKYKKIELILRLAKDFLDQNTLFVIAGLARDNDYLESLHKMTADVHNVVFYPYFIPDNEVFDFINAAAISILPYDINSSLNSSSAVLSLSCGKNVIISQVGTALEFPNNLAYSYSYQEGCDEYASLKEKYSEALSDYLNSRESFLRRQNELVSFVKNEWSIEAVACKCKKIYEDIL